MAAPTTLLQRAQQNLDNAKQASAAAQQQLASAQTTVGGATADLAAATSEAADLKSQASAIRAQLAAIPAKADGEALSAALEQIVIRARRADAAVVDAQAALQSAQSHAGLAQALSSAATASVAVAQSSLDQAIQDDARRQKWKTALAAAPLKDISADATAVLAGQSWTDAKKRASDDFTAALLQRASERRTNEANCLAQAQSDALAAEDAALVERDTNGGREGKASKLWVAFLRAQAKVRDLFLGGETRLAQAAALSAKVADPTNSPLTADERAAINTTDATLQTARTTALATEKARDDLQVEKQTKQNALTAAQNAAIAAGQNPGDVQAVKDAQTALQTASNNLAAAETAWLDKQTKRDQALEDVASKQTALAAAIQAAVAAKVDPNTDAKVQAAKTALNAAQTALVAAQADYEKSDAGVLHSWEAAVPDPNWQLLDSFQRAKQILLDLKGTDPAALSAALDTAEQNYLAARLKADASAAIIAQFSSEQTGAAAESQVATLTADAKLFGAMRGDY